MSKLRSFFKSAEPARQIISLKQHGISASQLPQHTTYILNKLCDAGYEAYMVGGGVRDLLLNKRPKDFDVVTNALPNDIKKVFGRRARIIGRRFRLVHVMINRELTEVSTFRTDKQGVLSRWSSRLQHKDGMVVRDNLFGDMASDAVRRDFTINALYYCIQEQSIIDYTGGYEDLRRKELNFIGMPERRCMEDPCRILRGIRFAALYDLRLPEEVMDLFHAKSELLDNVSQERVYLEIAKLFCSGNAVCNIQFMHAQNLLHVVIPCFQGGEQEYRMMQLMSEYCDQRDLPEDLSNTALMYLALINHDLESLLSQARQRRWKHMSKALEAQCIACIKNSGLFIPKRLLEVMVKLLHYQLSFTISANEQMGSGFFKSRYFRPALRCLMIRAEAYPHLSEKAVKWKRYLDDL